MILNSSKQVRLAFVDKHSSVLDEFKHSLVDERPDWSVRFFDDGQHLLSDMERREYDLVVSDIHLPGLSGGEFLRTVAQKAPETVRVVSYDLERQEDVMTHVDVWNQFITKPCEPDMLISVVEESLSLKEKPPGLSAVEVIKNLKRLPTIPAIYVELNRLLSDPNSCPEDIGDVVARDIALTSSLLRIVNSAQIGLRRNVATPHEAVSFLGVDIVKTLALGAKLFTMCDDQILRLPYLKNLWDHSINVSGAARKIMKVQGGNRKMVDEAMVAGLLHDAGKLVLATNDPQKTMEVLNLCREKEISLMKAEDLVFGFNHGDVGGVLFRLWGLSGKVVEAVKFHHVPGRSLNKDMSVLAALHVAEMVSQPLGEGSYGQWSQEDANLDYMQSVGMKGDLIDWKRRVDEFE